MVARAGSSYQAGAKRHRKRRFRPCRQQGCHKDARRGKHCGYCKNHFKNLPSEISAELYQEYLLRKKTLAMPPPSCSPPAMPLRAPGSAAAEVSLSELCSIEFAMHAVGEVASLPGRFANTGSRVGACHKTWEKQHWSVQKARGRSKSGRCNRFCSEEGPDHQVAIASNRVTNDATKMLAATNAADSDAIKMLAARRCIAACNAVACARLTVCEFSASCPCSAGLSDCSRA